MNRLFCLLIFCSLGALACGTTAAGGGGGGGATIGAPCNSTLQKELCSGTARLACTNNVWTILTTCATGQRCVTVAAADGKGMQSGCIDSGGDTISSGDVLSDSTSDGSSDIGSGTDALAGTDASGSDVADSGGGGCVNGNSCDDGDPCTTGDKCVGATCTGSAKNCDDADPCTADSCSGGTCQHTTIACSDGSTMDQAKTLIGGQAQADTLAPTGTARWFRFDGIAGNYILLATQTKQPANAYDPTIIDTVLTLYGPDQTPMAMNDDGWNLGTPDSELWTRLPQSGSYWVKVEECWTYAAANPGKSITCGGTAAKSDTAYTLYYDDCTATPLPGTQPELEANNVLASATPFSYVTASTGSYYPEALFGALGTGSDTDFFSFTVPNDVAFTQGRLTVTFSQPPGGSTGDGSPLSPVTAKLVNGTTGSVIASLVLDGKDMRVPVKTAAAGGKYALSLSHSDASFTANDWYVVESTLGGSNPIETNDALNNQITGAQGLTAVNSSTSGADFFIGGDITGGGTDVDYFAIQVPMGMSYLTLSCAAAAIGSGLGEFSVEVLTSAGDDLSGGAQIEAGSAIFIQNLSIPAGQTVMLLLRATSQQPGISGTYYECGAHVAASATP